MRRETDILKMLNHPNINRFVDLFETMNHTYIVLEQINGKNLYEYMKVRLFRLTEDRARDISFQLASALHYMSIYGVVHRDLKLENVMMSDHGN